MANQKVIHNFSEGNIPKQLIMFASPLFLSSLMQIIYNAVDMIVVGQKLGQVGLSAVSVGGDISHFLTFFAMGFSNAGQILISQYIGAKQQDKLGRFISTMFTTLMGCAVGVSAVCLALRHTLLQLMNTPAAAYDGALAYSTVSMIGLVFIYGYNSGSAVLRGMGDSRHPFIFISIASVLNILLDILFVMVLPFGCMGAALATVISQGISFVLSASYLYRNRGAIGIDFTLHNFTNPDKDMFLSLVKLGLPMAIKSASIQISKLFVNSFINSFGVAVSAFAGIANKIASISNLVSNSVNTAGSSMVGQNIGAEKYDRVPKIMLTVAAITFTVAITMSILFCTFPLQLFGIFSKEKEVLDIALEYLPIAVLMFFGSACRAPANALINGSGNYKMNFATAIFDGIVMRIGLAVLFGIVLNWGYLGFWLGDALAGFTPLVIGIVFFISGKWKKRTVS
ncbi:MAG: MATE family efflux transporter [Oscillospiraceae bacterium]|nr:MATE family efflux transporter [Oscillospiraceae bacterium]